ncbi:hypothetical protein Bca52824_051227 [Brassica carinata]|uniref:Uncharacterized protein n=1 Tax=Brassica carinata TaxID=52824 RepID=A0A8X7UIH5_BRACI|nr:hypothetical protein Bca52824_051227 [Brassica carinata]
MMQMQRSSNLQNGNGHVAIDVNSIHNSQSAHVHSSNCSHSHSSKPKSDSVPLGLGLGLGGTQPDLLYLHDMVVFQLCICVLRNTCVLLSG